MSDASSKEPAHSAVFNWKTETPYKWKHDFPLRPVLKPRQLPCPTPKKAGTETKAQAKAKG